MALMNFYLTCVPDCTLIGSKVSILSDDSEISNVPREGTHIGDNNFFKLDFPFLQDPATIKYIKNSKIMFVMRGLPGSGKSTVVKSIQSVYPNSTVCSADDYYLQDGVYNFDPDKLGHAHGFCKYSSQRNCQNGVRTVIIDNTNVKHWEMKFYLDLALWMNYVVLLVEPQTLWKFDADELAKRNKHGVSKEILLRKVEQFRDVVPSYYGWFLNEDDSRYLIKVARKLFEECVQKIPKLKNYLLVNAKGEADSFITDFFQRRDGNEILHCTSKFLARGKVPGASYYHHRKDVRGNYGKVSSLNITSITFSEKTVGARVHLDKQQLQLFDKPEERERDRMTENKKLLQYVNNRVGVQTYTESSPCRNPSAPTRDGAYTYAENSPSRNPSAPRRPGAHTYSESHPRRKPGLISSSKILTREQSLPKTGSVKHQRNIRNLNRHETSTITFQMEIYKILRHMPANKHSCLLPINKANLVPKKSHPIPVQPVSGFGRSAHITLGTIPGIQSKQTIFDVLDISDMEASRPFEDMDSVSVHGGRAVYLGGGLCSVYFYKSLLFQSLYSAYY